MADSRQRPVLKPVLHLTKDPRPQRVSGGGKTEKNIKDERLSQQRSSLAKQFATLAERADSRPQFNGRLIVYASMFDDSLAPSWTPGDLFNQDRNARLITPFRSGYLLEVGANSLSNLSRYVGRTTVTRELVDISRVENVRFFRGSDTRCGREEGELWDVAPELEGGRVFTAWLMPLRGRSASDALVASFEDVRRRSAISAPPMLESLRRLLGRGESPSMRRRLIAASTEMDGINAALREYRQRRRARTTVIIPTQRALRELVASGTIFRLEPVAPFNTTALSEGGEPERPLPEDLEGLPVVGVVDGGLTASSYRKAEAWRAPPLVSDADADKAHGNLVTSLIVQGHEWNPRLSLAPLHCRVGIAQAVPKSGKTVIDPQARIAYLDALMGANPETKVWNFSCNERQSCDLEGVSGLGHDLAELARKHRVLPIVSVGNRPGERLQPPADCEAGITVGGRLHGESGGPGAACPISHVGPGPSSMLKPEISQFSHVRALGGKTQRGSSFATALVSPLAAHTMQRLREPSPDLVKALLLHYADGDGYDPALGFGTPVPVPSLPWECRPGFVTLQWTAKLRPGVAYYWELPIARSLAPAGKLKGSGILTAVLNPHPMVSEFAGPNYFGARIATALQYQRGETKNGSPKFHNLLGSLDTDKIAEQEAREIDHKWSPVRHHKDDFHRVSYDGTMLRVYGRIYARDLYHYRYEANEDVPEMETVFVLSLGTGDPNDEIYEEIVSEMGAYVESSIVDTAIEIEND